MHGSGERGWRPTSAGDRGWRGVRRESSRRSFGGSTTARCVRIWLGGVLDLRSTCWWGGESWTRCSSARAFARRRRSTVRRKRSWGCLRTSSRSSGERRALSCACRTGTGSPVPSATSLEIREAGSNSLTVDRRARVCASVAHRRFSSSSDGGGTSEFASAAWLVRADGGCSRRCGRRRGSWGSHRVQGPSNGELLEIP